MESGLGNFPDCAGGVGCESIRVAPRAALSGHNAPTPISYQAGRRTVGRDGTSQFPESHRSRQGLLKNRVGKLDHPNEQHRLRRALQGSSVSFPSRADFALSGKVTRIRRTRRRLQSIRPARNHCACPERALENGRRTAGHPRGRIARRCADPRPQIARAGRRLGHRTGSADSAAGGRSQNYCQRKTAAGAGGAGCAHAHLHGRIANEILVRGNSLVLTATPSCCREIWQNGRCEPMRALKGLQRRIERILSSLRPAKSTNDQRISPVIHQCAGDPSVLTLESPLAQIYRSRDGHARGQRRRRHARRNRHRGSWGRRWVATESKLQAEAGAGAHLHPLDGARRRGVDAANPGQRFALARSFDPVRTHGARTHFHHRAGRRRSGHGAFRRRNSRRAAALGFTEHEGDLPAWHRA